MKIAFTTLACPNWSWERILEQASELGYDGIEIRGIEGEMFLPRSRPFLPENIDASMKQVRDAGLEIICLDTSCSFHDPDQFEAAIQEGKATIDLARKMGVPYMRVFGDEIPDQERKEETIADVARGLKLLGDYAEGTGITVLIETHGDFSGANDVLNVIRQAGSSAVAVLWDINNPYKLDSGSEPIDVTWGMLGSLIKHTHLKDTLGPGHGAQVKLPGEGDVPIRECIQLLKRQGYSGWLSFEWEKKWHLSIEEPEVALPHFIRYIKELI